MEEQREAKRGSNPAPQDISFISREGRKMKWILVGIVCACAVAALAIASFFCGSKTLEVELELKWTLSEAVSYTHLTLPTNREV